LWQGFGKRKFPYHLCRFRAGDIELEVRILLPVTEKQRELQKESVVGIAEGSEGLRTRVAIKPPFLSFASTDELLPGFEAIAVGFL
jgi:hypothetical protein